MCIAGHGVGKPERHVQNPPERVQSLLSWPSSQTGIPRQSAQNPRSKPASPFLSERCRACFDIPNTTQDSVETRTPERNREVKKNMYMKKCRLLAAHATAVLALRTED